MRTFFKSILGIIVICILAGVVVFFIAKSRLPDMIASRLSKTLQVKVQIGDMEFQAGSHMTYRYDFGDNWQFNVVVEEIKPVDKKLKKIKLLESRGDAPEQYPSMDEDEEDWYDEGDGD